MSELRTNRIIPRDGLASGTSGGIIQVVQATKTDTEQFTLATQTVKQYTTLTATITPTRSDSKILVNVNLSFCFSDDGKGHFGLQRTIGGGTAAAIACGASAGSRQQMSGGYYQDNQSYVNTVNFSFLDSPATTSACAYYPTFAHDSSQTKTYSINRSGGDSDSAQNARYMSSILLYEVSG